MIRDVFISYSSRDLATAETICALLEERGLACWIAPRNVLPGRNYDEEILSGIEGTRTIVLLLSEGSNESPHVKRELELAIKQGSAVIPIRIQNILPGRGLKYFLAGKQWVDAWQPPIERKMDEVAAAVRALDSNDSAIMRSDGVADAVLPGPQADREPAGASARTGAVAGISKISPVSFAVTTDLLVESDDGGAISVWSLADLTLVSRVNVGEKVQLEASPDGRTLVAWIEPDSSYQGELLVFALPSLELRCRSGYGGGVGSWSWKLCFGSYGFGVLTQHVRIVGSNGVAAADQIALWDAANDALSFAPLPGLGDRLMGLSPDGSMACTFDGDNGGLRIWNSKSGDLERTINQPRRSLESSGPSPDWRFIVHGKTNGTLEVRELQGDQVVGLCEEPLNVPTVGYQIVFAPSSRVCVWKNNSIVRVFSLPEAREIGCIRALDTEKRWPIQCAFSSDSTFVSTRSGDPESNDNTLSIWRLDDQLQRGRSARLRMSGRVIGAQFSKNLLFGLDSTRRLVAWDTEHWTTILDLGWAAT